MIEIYTDGSAVANGENKGKGGCAAIFILNGKVKHIIYKGFYPTKTGRMELMAVLFALKSLKKDSRVTFYSDSMYVVNTFEQKWIYKWKRSGWSCKNVDLMKQLLQEYEKFSKGSIRFIHVKGHSGNEFNELADTFANYKNFSHFEKDLEYFY